MTESYSEIAMDPQSSSSSQRLRSQTDSSRTANVGKEDKNRPKLLDLESVERIDGKDQIAKFDDSVSIPKLDGIYLKDGEMLSFVAEDLENKIKLSSPVAKKGDLCTSESRNSVSSLYRQALTPQLPALDPNILNELENEARKVASSVDSITENLAAILHSASALTVGCLETYRDAVCKSCDAVDHNIKSMYQLMAKCEELSKTMHFFQKTSERLKEIRKVLDLFESNMSL